MHDLDLTREEQADGRMVLVGDFRAPDGSVKLLTGGISATHLFETAGSIDRDGFAIRFNSAGGLACEAPLP